MFGLLGGAGRGGGQASYMASMLFAAVIQALMWTTIVFSIIFSLVFTLVSSSEGRSLLYQHTWLSAVSTFSASAKTEVAGKKIPAKVFLDLVQSDEELSARLRNARIAVGVAGFVAGVPSVLFFFAILILFSLIGKIQAKDELLRGAQLLRSVEEFNELNERKNIRGVMRVERAWVKRLRNLK